MAVETMFGKDRMYVLAKTDRFLGGWPFHIRCVIRITHLDWQIHDFPPRFCCLNIPDFDLIFDFCFPTRRKTNPLDGRD